MLETALKNTSDLAELTAAFEAKSLIRPDAGSPNVVDLAAAIFDWAGVLAPSSNENSKEIGAHIADATNLVFVIADGLGMCFINKTRPASILRRHLVTQLATVFPSTTPAVLTTLATAAWPNTHGIVGWDMYLEEIDDVAAIITFATRLDGEPLDRLGLRERQAYPLPSLCGALEGQLVSITPRRLAGSAFSDYWTGRNAEYVAYDGLDGGVDEALSIIRSAGSRSVTCLYTDVVDAAAHRFGVHAPQTLEALRSVEQAVERLAAGLPSSARVVLTADHGLLDGPTHEILPTDHVVRHLRHEPWGDDRQMHFAVYPENTSVFEEEFRRRYGHIAFLLSINEVEALRLLGPGRIGPATRKRLGTHLAVSRGADALSYRIGDDSRNPIGIHSGLTPDEMLVPLIII